VGLRYLIVVMLVSCMDLYCTVCVPLSNDLMECLNEL
jgi:hypothetical protein